MGNFELILILTVSEGSDSPFYPPISLSFVTYVIFTLFVILHRSLFFLPSESPLSFIFSSVRQRIAIISGIANSHYRRLLFSIGCVVSYIRN